ELKTKPTQHSVKELREIGIQPDVLLCRCETAIPQEVRSKIALFCNVPANAVIATPDVRSIYEVPLVLHRGGLDVLALEGLALGPGTPLDLSRWESTVRAILEPEDKVRIAVCGKYTHLQDAYKSILEAFVHAGAANGVQVEVKWIESTELESREPEDIFDRVDGLLVPGGFGERGIEGMIRAIRYAREHGVPFFGICLGLHCASIEIARHLCNLEHANSTEFDPETPHPVIDLMPDQVTKHHKGGTMRLGAYPCDLQAGSRAREAYGDERIRERHRHRWEFNDDYRSPFEEAGVRFTGICPDNGLVEILELESHPWFLAVQFHPELKSRPERPHPIFRSFVAAALRFHRGKPAPGITDEPSGDVGREGGGDDHDAGLHDSGVGGATHV
ncbi:MAG: CTP synthase, partial [Candidatus Eisenbacteria bacterium]